MFEVAGAVAVIVAARRSEGERNVTLPLILTVGWGAEAHQPDLGDRSGLRRGIGRLRLAAAAGAESITGRLASCPLPSVLYR